jgi:hypothetical protein
MLHLRTKDKRLLLEGLRIDREEEAFGELLRSSLNWNEILTTAQHLGVAAQLYASLSKSENYSIIPKEIGYQFKETLIGQQAQNMKLFVKLKEILAAFAHEGIPVIVLKGAALAQFIYPHLGFRPMGDIDLLVKHHDLTKAENILGTLKYQPSQTEKSAEWYRLHHHHLIPYISQEGFSPIELHHHIIPPEDPNSLPIQELWDRAQPAEIEGSPCFVLSPEDFLFHLCHHLSSSNYFLGQLRGLCDLASIIRRCKTEINWGSLLDIAHTYKSKKFLYYSLWLAQEKIGAKVPLHVLRKLKSSIRRLPLEDLWFKRLIQEAVFIHDPSKSLLHVWLLQDTCADLLSQKSRWHVLQNIFHRIWIRYMHYAQCHFPSTSRFGFLYSAFIYPLYLVRKSMGWDPRPKKRALSKL